MPRKTKVKEEAPSPFKGVKMQKFNESFYNFGEKSLWSSMLVDRPEYGLFKGSDIFIEVATELNENSLYLWKVEGRETPFIDSFYWNFGDLHIGGVKQNKLTTVCLGEVVGVFRPYAFKETQKPAEAAQTDEITVTCRGCQKQLTGSRSFLSSMAWRLKPDYAECPACW